MSDWEKYLAQRFPGYLLPDSAVHALSQDEARRFLDTLSGRADALALLRAVSLLSPRVESLAAFCVELDRLVRTLPAETVALRQVREGGFHGRLVVPETLAYHQAGRRSTFAMRTRRRSFDLPENRLVRAVARRLLDVATLVRSAGVFGADRVEDGLEGSAAAARRASLRASEGALRRILAASPLRDVADNPIGALEEAAGRSARQKVYREAASWWAWIRAALDDRDPARVARFVAEGALLPLAAATRFELAVAIRFAERLFARLTETDDAWRLERSLVLPGRRDLLAIHGPAGRVVRLHYNQAVLPGGPADAGGLHYLGNRGRLRPDVTVTIEDERGLRDALVIECKHSDRPDYLLGGYHEALLYRWEYAAHLHGWPKAILVASSSDAVVGMARPGDDVIASGWPSWPPEAVVEAFVTRAHAAH